MRTLSLLSPAAGPAAARIARLPALLIGARAARSVGQGALAVDFALYLRALGWSGAAIGILLMASLLLATVLTAAAGPLSDRFGRKRFLIGYEVAYALAALAALSSSRSTVIVIAALIGGFGRGANGTAGPFAPVEQAWLAQAVPRQQRGRLYSGISATGFAGMAAGALLAALAGVAAPHLGPVLAHRLLFAPVLLGSLLCLGFLAAAIDLPSAPPPAAAEPEQAVRRGENALLLRLTVANALQGVGIGLTGPLIAYWFAERFGHGPGVIGPLMAAGFALATVMSLLTGRLAGQHGIVRVVVGMRLVGLALMVALPLVPSFPVAAAIYLLRSGFNRGTNGARQALSISLVRPHRGGFAASLSAISIQIPRAIGPVLAGALFDAGLLAAPFLAGAVFQAGFLWLYQVSFRDYERRSGMR
jgi:MFS family permease